jgi:hypothetical protein
MRFSLPRLALSAALFCSLPSSAATPSLPEEVGIRAFIKPAGHNLQVLVRVPMAALNQIQFPLRDSGYLDLPLARTALPGAARYWIANSVDVYENGVVLPKPRIAATRIAIESDDSFFSYDTAIAHLNGPEISPDTNTFPSQSWLDISFEYPVHSDRSDFSVDTKFAHLGVRVSTALKFLQPDGTVRSFTWQGDPGRVVLDPNWPEVAAQFIRWGFSSFLGGTDYLLFLFCLVLPFRRVRDLVPVTAALASAIPITLIASALGLAPDTLWFAPLIATLVAVTILYTALENIAAKLTPTRRAILALVFGMIYGFSFAINLGTRTQFSGSFPLVSAIAFTVGTELALIAAAAVLVPVLRLLFRFSTEKKIESIILSVLAAHTAWHWMTERYAILSRFPLRWPVIDAALLAAAMQWMMIFVIFGGAVWFVSGALRARNQRGHEA